MITLGIPKGLNQPILKIKPPEVMTLPLQETHSGALSLGGYKKIKDFIKNADVLIMGPGLSQDKSTQRLARKIAASRREVPAVIDADGLNALAGRLNSLRTVTDNSQPETILTPHPGEMARLLGVAINTVQENREKAAKTFAKAYKVTLVLKGQRTIVVDHKGNLYINKTGNPGMATAGSGDVLTGIIGAFLGQGLRSFEAAKYAVYLHGLAGDLAAEEKTQMGMIASDIIDKIPEAIKKATK